MVSIRKTRIFQILMLTSALALSGCLTDEYDLSDGINTDVSIGGDSLSIPIGKTDTVFLGSLLNGQDTSLLKETADGKYLISFSDSIDPVKFDGVNPVSFSISPISISTISTNFAAINFPTFPFSPINIASDLPIPDITIENKKISSIDTTFLLTRSLKGVSVKRQGVAGSTKITSAKNTEISTGLIVVNENYKSKQSLKFLFPTQLKKINKIALSSSKVTLTFDKSKIKALGFKSQNDTIKRFQINYPAEFRLKSGSNIPAVGTRISGSSFIIEDAVLNALEDIYTASFIVESLNMTNIPQNNELNYTSLIDYHFDYSFIGTLDSEIFNTNPKLELVVSLKSEPVIDNMEIETNPFAINVPEGTNAINQIVDNIPNEISEVKSLTFENGAALELSISDPAIHPFTFSAGMCKISLPKNLLFKPFNGLNNSNNELTIPYNELFIPKTIGIAGMNINKPIINQQITITDELNYRISGLTIGSVATDLNTVQAIKNKKLNVVANMVNLTIKDASLKTKSISVAIPPQNSNINISQFVSDDVKKVYTATLKNPAALKLSIDISNLPTNIDSLFFDNYVITLPGSLRFKADNELVRNTTTNKNILTLNRGFKISDGFSKTLVLEMFDFGANGKDLSNGTFNLNEAVTMQGNAYVKGTDLNSSQLGTMEIKPSISLGNMTLSLIEAKISPAIEAVSETIKLDFPDALKGGDNNLNIKDPVITFEIGNTMGIPLSIALNLVPKSKGVVIPNANITTTLNIAAATVLGQTTWSKFRLSKVPSIIMDEYQNITLDSLSNLLKTIPDVIDVQVIPTITGERHKVDLYSPKNQLDVKYGLNIPLDFENDFKVNYTDTIDGLKGSLEDVLKLTSNIEIVGVVNSTIPLDLSFTATPWNSSNQKIDDIVITTGTITSNSLEQIKFGLKETAEGALKQLDKILLTVTASKSPYSILPLKADQYFIVELRVKLPKGITIKE